VKTILLSPGRLVVAAGVLILAGGPLAALDSAPIPATAKKEKKVAKTRDYAHTLAVLKTSQGDVTVILLRQGAGT
jgi:hypothetical protein